MITISVFLVLAKIVPSAISAISQSTTQTSVGSSLPVLLVHGYASDSSVSNELEEFLDRDGIPYQKVNFGLYQGSPYDQCGMATAHGNDLAGKIDDVKTAMGTNQ